MNIKASLAHRMEELPFGVRLVMFWRSIKAIPARHKAIGRRSVVSNSVKVIGWSRLKIGDFTVICDDTWFNANHPHPSISIGSHCYIGLRNFFTSGVRICVGDFTITAPNCCFLGAHHEYSDPWIAHAAAPVTSNGVIETGVNCAFGAGAIILADSKIGHGSMIGAGSVVRGIIPPFSLVVGNPGRIIKRFDFVQKKWVRTSEFRPELNEHVPNEESYRIALKERFPHMRSFPGYISRSFGNS